MDGLLRHYRGHRAAGARGFRRPARGDSPWPVASMNRYRGVRRGAGGLDDRDAAGRGATPAGARNLAPLKRNQLRAALTCVLVATWSRTPATRHFALARAASAPLKSKATALATAVPRRTRTRTDASPLTAPNARRRRAVAQASARALSLLPQTKTKSEPEPSAGTPPRKQTSKVAPRYPKMGKDCGAPRGTTPKTASKRYFPTTAPWPR